MIRCTNVGIEPSYDCYDMCVSARRCEALKAWEREKEVEESKEKRKIEDDDPAIDMAIEALNGRPKGECRTCKRCSDHCCETDEDFTRCPIEEHYALPKDGYCHLYQQI